MNHPASNKFVPIGNDAMEMEGCCLFYDNQSGECVRSGKANRESENSFRHRLDDHEKASYLKTQQNRNIKFYLSYSTGKIETKDKCEWLKPYCVFVFDLKVPAAVNTINDEKYFNHEHAKSHLNYTNLRNENVTTAYKNMVSCLFKCFYDMKLSNECNVSESPRHELIVKQFGRREN